jgi:hypothetical protein
MLKFEDDQDLNDILLEAAVHIKLSLEMKNIIEIYYPLYKFNYKNDKFLLIPLELGVCTLSEYMDYLIN